MLRYVAVRVLFNDLCCWTQRCGLLSRIHFTVTDQSSQTGPNESVLHFKIVIVVCWHQIGKLVQVVYIIFTLILPKTTKTFGISSYIYDIETNLLIGKHTLRVFTWKLKEIIGKSLFGSFIQCLFRFVLFLVTFNGLSCWTQRCGLLPRIHLRVTDQSWQTSPNKSVLHFKVVFVVCWHQIGKLVQVVYITISLILFKLHKLSSSVRLLKILKQIFQLESSPWVVFHAIFKRLFPRFGFDAPFMCLFQFFFFHTVISNKPKLAHWSNSNCITLWSCFCSLLTSNWEVSTCSLHYSFIDYTQNTKKFVISSCTDDIETNIPIGKHTMRVIKWHL